MRGGFKPMIISPISKKGMKLVKSFKFSEPLVKQMSFKPINPKEVNLVKRKQTNFAEEEKNKKVIVVEEIQE